MPLDDKDRELWRITMKDVTPLRQASVPETTNCFLKTTPASSTRHTWDLHGMTLGQAHQLTLSEIHQQQHLFKSVTFITGKSGQMRQEFCHWLDRVPGVSRIESLNGGGAYRVWFKKARQNKK